jgi:GxxExxY protein
VRQIPFARELSLPVVYKGARVDCSYRLDFLVDEWVVVEAVESRAPIHEAQC